MKNTSKSQNLSVMLTDIQGFTDTSSASSRGEIINLIRRHNKLMIPVIEFYRGTVIKSIGDALLCTFPSATDAVVCGIIIQLLLTEYNVRQSDEFKQMRLRVVVNTGDVSLEENDIFGEAVNVTARMEGLSCFPGGTIGISESTYLLMNRNEIIAEKVGTETLKGIPEPVTVYKIPLEKQKLTAIPAKLLQLVEKIVDEKGSGGEISVKSVNEWTSSVKTLLKDSNWEDNLDKIGKRVESGTKHIHKTFTRKTVIESKKQDKFTDATIPKRIQSFVIDFFVIIVISIFLRGCLWVLNSMVSLGVMGSAIGLVFKIPVIFVFLYFAIMWSVKGASFGQIASGTAVVTNSGEKPDFQLSAKRSLLFIISVAFFCLGVAMILIGDKKTLYDAKCDTRVIE